MLAVSITFLIAAYVLGPDLLSRLVLSFVVPRRSVTQSRGEEVTRAVLWVTLPLGMVIVWVRWHHVLSMWGNWCDLETVASGLYSTTFFDAHHQQFYDSLYSVLGMNASLLLRLYALVFLFAVLIDIAILRYRWLRSILKPRWAKSILATLILPRVSEWHILLSDMLLPADDVTLAVDVLTKSGTLYQGAVQDRVLGTDGSLQSLTLSDPRRFLRDEFKKAKDGDRSTKTDTFWRIIPSKLFVILGTDIASINVRYPPKRPTSVSLTQLDLSPAEVNAVRDLLSKLIAPQQFNPADGDQAATHPVE